MNVTRVLSLGKAAKENHEHFEMRLVQNGNEPLVFDETGHIMPCNTTCCFAGFAAYMFADVDTICHVEIEELAQEVLELTPSQANSLFFGNIGQYEGYPIFVKPVRMPSEQYGELAYQRVIEFVKNEGEKIPEEWEI